MHAGQLVAGRYRLDEPVGAGGMAVVWRATDVELGRVVALKRALPGSGGRAAPQMLDEARIAAGLHHPHVVTLFDVLVDGADRWLVMEYLPSRSLAQLRTERGSLVPREVARIGAQIADALDTVHARDIVHGDVTPGNVLVAENGTAKLTDFGVSRALWNDVTLTDNGLVCGTPAYLAPEVARGYEPRSASDVFSLGATLFAAVEGGSPFGPAQNSLELIRRSAEGQLNRPRHAGPLAGALSAMLQVEPTRRPDAARARQLLREAAGFPAELAGAAPIPVSRSRRRVKVALAATAFVAITGTVLVASHALPPTRTGQADPAKPPLMIGSSSAPAPPAPGMGDQRTADPCALTDTVTFAGFGSAELSTDQGNFNRCDVIVRKGASKVDVKVQLDGAAAASSMSPGQVSKVGKLTVVRAALDNGECDRTVILPDQNLVEFDAIQNGSGPADLCAMAEAATARALPAVDQGPVPRRPAPFDAASVAHLDACALLDAPALGSIPGIDAGTPVAGFGNWDCRWSNNAANGTVAELKFDRNGPLDPSYGRLTRLSGRATYVLSGDNGPGTCVARIVQRSYTDVAGQPTVDLVYLEVDGDPKSAPPCTFATALAGDAAAKLPAP